MLLRPDVPWILTIRDGAGSLSEARASVRTKVLYMGSRQREKKSMIALQSDGFYSIFLLTEKTGNLIRFSFDPAFGTGFSLYKTLFHAEVC